MHRWKNFTVLAAVTFFLFGPAMGDFFVSDDFDWLHIASQGEPLWKAFVGNYYGQHGVGGTFRPLVNVFFEVMTRVAGLSSLPYHAVQLVVHALNAFLVYCLARLVWPRETSAALAWIAGLVFVAMPQHTEAVVWIAAIGDPLATAGMLGCLLLYIRWRETDSRVHRWASVLLLGAALLTKEIAITMPLLVLGYEMIILRTFAIRTVLGRTWPYWIVVASYLGYRWWAIGIGVGYYAESSLQFDLFRSLQALIAYDVGSLLVGEWRIAVTQVLQQYWYAYLAGAIGVAGMLVRWTVRGEYQGVVFAAYFWLVNIALVTPLRMSMLTDEGERYGYIASVGVALLVAWAIVRLTEIRYFLGVGVGVVIISYYVVQLDMKLRWWGQASQVSAAVVEQLAQLPFDEYQKNYLIGLPDTLYGAPILRNGAVQATALMRDDDVVVERIPVYTQLSRELLDAPIYGTLQRLPDGAHYTVRDGQYLITGNATESHPEYRFELWNYDYTTNLSNTIRIQFQGGREYDWARGDIALWYYEAGMIKQFTKE